MRLSNAWILAFATLSSSISAFQLSSIATTTKRNSVSNNIQATKTEELEDLYKVSSTPTTTTNTHAADESHHTNGDSSMTYADINKLAYRALQKQCKTLDLIAVGTTSTLRGRLLDHYHLSRETNDIVVDVPKATAEEIEVRYIICLRFVFSCHCFHLFDSLCSSQYLYTSLSPNQIYPIHSIIGNLFHRGSYIL